jgi:hypothetical protein
MPFLLLIIDHRFSADELFFDAYFFGLHLSINTKPRHEGNEDYGEIVEGVGEDGSGHEGEDSVVLG